MKKYRYSKDPDTYFNDGIEKYKERDYTGAVSDLSITIELSPNHHVAYYTRGLIYGKELKKFKKSINDFTKAIELKADYAEAYFNRGVTYLIFDYIKKACADWHKAKELGYEPAGELIDKYCNIINKP